MLDATQFDDAYTYGYYSYDLPKMRQICVLTVPTSPYHIAPERFGDVIGTIPCSDGMVYLLRLRETFSFQVPTAPEYPETPKGANGPGPNG